jgi:ferredoxin-NADP reductase/MOSC domain-containing protein YiiM
MDVPFESFIENPVPKLLSVNVGLPREMEWQGKLVRTAIWKRPVPHRVAARRLNLDGDGQADLKGHGGEHRAVMVYQIQAYQYWQRQLGRDDFELGQFGENFTVDGLPDDEVCIGDRYRIGSAVFEVTQPRVTCYRLGIRMNNPQMPALLVSHRKPGFYLRVIEEGEVGADDEILKIADGPEKISVAEVDSLLYLPNHNPSRIAIATNIPALSAGWKSSLQELLKAEEKGVNSGNAGLTPSISPPPAWNGFRKLRVASVHRETSEVTSIEFTATDESSLPPALPGQYLVLRFAVDKNLPPIIRSYSISNPSASGTYRISVKRGTGPGSRYLVDTPQIGDMFDVSAPRGDFVLRAGSHPVVLLSAGIGITPVLSMLYALASSGRAVWWIHATRNAKEQAFAEETKKLLGTIPGNHSAIAYSKPGPADQLGKNFDIEGHLNLATLQRLGFPVEADFYLCGPAGFLTDMRRDLASLGVAPGNVYQEVFGPADSIEPGVIKATKAPHPPVGAPGSGPIVSFTRSGLAVHWDKRFSSLLELAEACDIPVKWSCRTGVCHMCECGILDGKLRYAPEPLDQPAAGNALICCSTPESQVNLDL